MLVKSTLMHVAINLWKYIRKHMFINYCKTFNLYEFFCYFNRIAISKQTQDVIGVGVKRHLNLWSVLQTIAIYFKISLQYCETDFLLHRLAVKFQYLYVQSYDGQRIKHRLVFIGQAWRQMP